MFPVDAFQNTLAKFAVIVERHRIRFHLTGGLTGVAYGEPRMTQDIDIVIDPRQTRSAINDFIGSLGESDFLFDDTSVRAAVGDGKQFQLLDEKEILKLDIYPREMIPGELDRSEVLELFEGRRFPVVSRVDAAASKLIWVSKGSHKSRRDLRAIYRKADGTQKEMIQRTAESLRLAALLTQIVAEPDELELE